MLSEGYSILSREFLVHIMKNLGFSYCGQTLIYFECLHIQLMEDLKVNSFWFSMEVNKRACSLIFKIFFPPCFACMSAQSCPTLCDPVDYSPPGSSVCRISQARVLEWVAISYSRGSSLGIEPVSLAFLVLVGKFFTTELPGKPRVFIYVDIISSWIWLEYFDSTRVLNLFLQIIV